MNFRKLLIAGSAVLPAGAAFAHTGGHGENAVATLIHFLTSAPHNAVIMAAAVVSLAFVVRAIKKTRS